MAEDVQPTEQKIQRAHELACPCRICPRLCEVDRPADQKGYCGVGSLPIVSSAGPHFGEEPPLVGRGGSGTIFLAGCNLLCAFCQNYDISHGPKSKPRPVGRPMEPGQMAEKMLALQRRGCENVNFVTPSHVVPWVMEAVRKARLGGLEVPIVYNCGGYERGETLRLLEGTVDIYMPDAKFMDPEPPDRYMKAPDYPERLRESLKEMHCQVGDLQVHGGVATRGLLVRHLVMPGYTEDSKAVLRFVAEEISAETAVNVMEQYRPLYGARDHPEISRPITASEYHQVREYARRLGLRLL